MRRDPWQALADPTRRKMIEILSEGQLHINEIAEKFDISRPAVSKHLKLLQESSVIEISKVGRERVCTLTPQNLQEVYDWVAKYEKFWLRKLDGLDDYLKKTVDKD